jgi:CRP/FNR family transcriptional regulator, anaerobic regulatory protein
MYASTAPSAPRIARPRAPAVTWSRDPLELETSAARLQLARRPVQAKQSLFRAGQPLQSLFLVHAGFFRTSVLSGDGREKITGFRMRGDLLGIDALGTDAYACDAIALDVGEVWELPCAQLDTLVARLPELQRQLTAAMAREIRSDWRWMLTLGSLGADQRVAAFLLDMAARQRALGYSACELMLRMTRAEIGNFLALQLETVTRVLTRLASMGLIRVDRREIGIADANGLQQLVATPATCH